MGPSHNTNPWVVRSTTTIGKTLANPLSFSPEITSFREAPVPICFRQSIVRWYGSYC